MTLPVALVALDVEVHLIVEIVFGRQAADEGRLPKDGLHQM